ncbi:MAG: universal stress protein [Bacteroidota bacterium]|nr:universal stress protein [Bacteroidota bacterium]MDP4250907.1 universal stress protein [Bacteroidota bacterium]
MKNILLAVNAAKLEMNAVEFACYTANLSHSKLTGVFLENIHEPRLPELRTFHGLPFVETIIADDIPQNREMEKSFQNNIRLFNEACVNRGVCSYAHLDRDAPVKAAIAESRFADMIILNAETSFKSEPENIPTAFVKEVMAKSECPVILSPLSFEGIDELLFAYDGSLSSVFAIKQFIYLFPELENKRVTILHVEDESSHQPEQNQIEGLVKAHYADVSFHVLQGKAKDELFSYLLGKQNTFVVMGAFGRSLVSDLFRPSAAGLVVRVINLPIFIAHH